MWKWLLLVLLLTPELKAIDTLSYKIVGAVPMPPPPKKVEPPLPPKPAGEGWRWDGKTWWRYYDPQPQPQFYVPLQNYGFRT